MLMDYFLYAVSGLQCTDTTGVMDPAWTRRPGAESASGETKTKHDQNSKIYLNCSPEECSNLFKVSLFLAFFPVSPYLES